MKRKIIAFIGTTASFFLLASPVLAHVVVKPDQAGIAAFQTFTVGVPNEKDNPTISLRLVIPDGLKSVSPNVKPGWRIEAKKNGTGDDTKVTEIDWTGGSIPTEERDDFLFSAQVPSGETTLKWKTYQTYSDGTVVSWDQEPKANMSDDDREMMEKKNLGPYAQTKIVNDLKGSTQTTTTTYVKNDKTSILSIVAIVLSVAAIGMQLKRKK